MALNSVFHPNKLIDFEERGNSHSWQSLLKTDIIVIIMAETDRKIDQARARARRLALSLADGVYAGLVQPPGGSPDITIRQSLLSAEKIKAAERDDKTQGIDHQPSQPGETDQISSSWEAARDTSVQHPALERGGFRVLGGSGRIF